MAWECDAQWSGVKQRKNAAPSMPGGQRATGGEQTAVAADSKLVGSWLGGKRTDEQPLALVPEAHARLRAGHRPAMCTEAFARDESARVEGCGRRDPAKARGRPVRRWRQGLASGHGKKSSTGGRVEGVAVRAGQGKARLAQVRSLLGSTQSNPRVGARHNGTSRLRHQRKVRKTLACAQARRSPGWMRWWSVGLSNCCRPPSSVNITQADQGTPRSLAMAAGVADHLWSTRAWLLRPVLGGQR
jgi:hypothetical protein